MKHSNTALVGLRTALVALISLTTLLSSCGAPALDKKFDGKDFSFSYPSDWALTEVEGGVDLVANGSAKMTLRMAVELSSKTGDTASIEGMASNLTQSLKGKITVNETKEIEQNKVLWIETKKEDGLTVVYPFDRVVYILQLENGDHPSKVMAAARAIAESFVPKTKSVDVGPGPKDTPPDVKPPEDKEGQGENNGGNEEPPLEKPIDNKPVAKDDFTDFDNYMFKMPAGWEKDGDSTSVITFFAPKDKQSGTFVTVAVQPVAETTKAVDIAKQMRDSIAPQAKIIDVKIFDGPAYRFEYKTDDGKKEAQTIVKKGGMLYLINYVEGKTSFWSDYELIISTFIPK